MVKHQHQQQSSSMKNQQQKLPRTKLNQQINNEDYSESQSESVYSSQDEDAVLLTNKVQQKILQTVARLKSKDPSIYQLKESIFNEEDFEEQEAKIKNHRNSKEKKFTYKDLLHKGTGKQEQESESQSEQQSQQELPPALEEKKAKNKFKAAIQKQLKPNNANKVEQKEEDDLFVVKKKLKKEFTNQSQKEKDKFEQFTEKMKPQAKNLIKKVWSSEDKMDETDLFLKNYILGKKWLQKSTNVDENLEKVDEEDQERSLQMDQYEAKYNFRFQEPEGDKIVQYPRKIQESLRIKPQTRKQKRKKAEERKKQQLKKLRQEAEKKKEQLKENIIAKISEKQNNNTEIQQENNLNIQIQKSDSLDGQGFQNDWFFCDDCGKGFEENQVMYECQECQDYMLCRDCHELIIHKHPLYKNKVPKGFGAPAKSEVKDKILSKLHPCKICRRKIPIFSKHYEYKDRSMNIQIMCQKCYDQSPLDVKKKFTLTQTKLQHQNISDLLDKDPEKVKELTNSKEIEEMVDQYLKYQFQDVLAGGLKAKFKYMNVKPESFGLSDQQILFGDDKQLNKYVSIKKLAPYKDDKLKLRNNIYKKKVVNINKTVQQNKKLSDSGTVEKKMKKNRLIEKVKKRAEIMKKKRQHIKKIRLTNISNPQNEKKAFIPAGRLASYGVSAQK